MVGLPLYGDPSWRREASLIQLVDYELRKPNPHEFIYQWIQGTYIHEARNKLVEAFLRIKRAEYFLFIDGDMTFPRYALEKLLADDKDIVTGLYVGRREPHRLIARVKVKNTFQDPEIKEGLIEVDGVGMGFCLIKRKVFEAMSYPWFEYDMKQKISSDIQFCLKAKEKGFRVFVDTDVRFGHVGEKVYTVEEDYLYKVE